MAEPVYRLLEFLVTNTVAAIGPRITFYGGEHIPDRGGAVVAAMPSPATRMTATLNDGARRIVRSATDTS